MNSKKESLRRREFLSVAAGASLSTLLPKVADAQETQNKTPPARVPGMIIREKQPENLEFPFATLDSPDAAVTKNERFYIRSHFPVPALEPGKWRLRVEGAVKTPLELTYDDLLKMPSQTVPATLECAGNSRVFLAPTVKGAQWGLGAVSHAEWTGVPLAAILKRAGVLPGAVEVVLEGADSGEIKDPPKPTGAVHFARSLPLDRANRPEVLLAFRMNGEVLPAAHGFPLRVIVPGWYGMASVKWLTRIVVVEKPYDGYFQTIDYAIWEQAHGLKSRVPVTEMQIKSEIARPEMHEVVPAGKPYRVCGAAWTGDADVTKVELSTDGGKTWNLARLTGTGSRHAWRLWEYNWQVPAARGRYTLQARATDSRGNAQPLERVPDRENYLINHVLPIDIEVQ